MQHKLIFWAFALLGWGMTFYLLSGLVYAVYLGQFMNAYYAGGFASVMAFITIIVTQRLRS